jgi:hypothetical protein
MTRNSGKKQELTGKVRNWGSLHINFAVSYESGLLIETPECADEGIAGDRMAMEKC